MGRKHRLFITIIFLTTFALPVLSADVVHILSQGETLYSLARRYNVSLDELLTKNNISDPSGLSIGTHLIIPGKEAPREGLYTVEKGDTYYGIAGKYSMEVDVLLSLNERDSSRVLRVGETLVVSRNEEAPTVRLSVPWWPVAGYKQPLNGKLEGVAIEADPLSYVRAVAGGNVVWTGPYRGFGHVVLVDSNGYIYLYGGNEDLFVNVGQTITAGSRIGRLGSSGPDGGKQDMIFSVFREGVPVSPDDAPRG